MELLRNIFLWIKVAFVVSIPLIWMWVFYHRIKCRKVQSCADRECKYWEWCNHNHLERKKDEIYGIMDMIELVSDEPSATGGNGNERTESLESEE